MLIIGGIDSEGNAFSSGEVFDLNDLSRRCTAPGNPPFDSYYATAGITTASGIPVCGGGYIVGETQEHSISSDCLAYSQGNQSWSPLTTLPDLNENAYLNMVSVSLEDGRSLLFTAADSVHLFDGTGAFSGHLATPPGYVPRCVLHVGGGEVLVVAYNSAIYDVFYFLKVNEDDSIEMSGPVTRLDDALGTGGNFLTGDGSPCGMTYK